MKKIISFALACVLMLTFAACGEKADTDSVEKVLNSMEYSMYCLVFMQDGASGFVNKTTTKEGIFAAVEDNYSSVTRYYVWGYADETLCCDWQWEFVPQDTDDLPPIGSKVKVTGSFVKSEDALDGYWISDASVKTVSEYDGASGERDTTTMSPTLTRVQLVNLMVFASKYEGKTVKIYGRVASGNKLQHPYYDNAWVVDLDYDGELPAIGTYVTVDAVISGSDYDDFKLIVQNLVQD